MGRAEGHSLATEVAIELRLNNLAVCHCYSIIESRNNRKEERKYEKVYFLKGLPRRYGQLIPSSIGLKVAGFSIAVWRT